MTLRDIALKFENRILAFLQNVASGLAQSKIFVETPRRMWDGLATGYEWWLLVYPFARVDRPPHDALIIMMKLLVDEATDQVMFALELGKVDGSSVDDLEVDIFVERDNLAALNQQIADFEDPSMIREVVKRVQAYIGKVRRRHPQGPREWSPRMKGSLGAKKSEFKPVIVNIVTQEGWKEWSDDDWQERVQKRSDEYYQAKMEDEGECESLIEAIMGEEYSRSAPEGPRDWSPKTGPIGPKAVKKACFGFSEGRLEGVEYMIRDAIQYMYEDAMMPDDSDITYALSETRDDISEKPDLDEIWEPLIAKTHTEKRIMRNLVNQIDYSRQQTHYDRYLSFNFMASPEVTYLVEAYPIEDRGWVRDALQFHHFIPLRERFLKLFFRKLSKDMEGSDPDNRTDWNKHWKAMLRDEDRVKEVRKEIRKYLKTAPPIPEEEE